jgi:predicted acyl esterase
MGSWSALMSEQVPALARTRYTPYYLRSQGQANSLDGDGRLELAAPAEEPLDRFVYDPDNPVPSCGGNTLIIPMGVQDQRWSKPDTTCWSIRAPQYLRLWR